MESGRNDWVKPKLKENDKEHTNLDTNDNRRITIYDRMILILVNIKRNKNYEENKEYLNDRIEKIVTLVKKW